MNDYEVIVAGVASMLSEERHRIRVTALSTPAEHEEVDVILYDTFGPANSMAALDELVASGSPPVIVYTWKLRRDLAGEALRRGASGYLSKALSGQEIADAVQAVVQGDTVVSPDVQPALPLTGRDWPGRTDAGLSAREAEVLSMIAAGMRNLEIADHSQLSINSVKTYIRSTYQKIGVTSRSQAMLWALDHGFLPEPGTSAPTEPPLG
ncbi:response regulator transcription factor [Nocardioides cynanchi]|uniref:response regulator transcription factor n=1 Tax=Nocardioides cynanchi TaxID=2558918 RepID=UPI001EE2E078|nr:response regulator transcription factor [Nocardioides cynanchi]